MYFAAQGSTLEEYYREQTNSLTLCRTPNALAAVTDISHFILQSTQSCSEHAVKHSLSTWDCRGPFANLKPSMFNLLNSSWDICWMQLKYCRLSSIRACLGRLEIQLLVLLRWGPNLQIHDSRLGGRRAKWEVPSAMFSLFLAPLDFSQPVAIPYPR